MSYVLLQFTLSGGFFAYQEAQSGQVTRYCDDQGNTLFLIPPTGDGGAVVDANPPRLPWML